MDRKAALTAPLQMEGIGLEIAPYFNPLLTKDETNVYYVDCIDNDTIREKAAQNPGAKGREVPAIDWVWVPGKSLRACIPRSIRFDYCVASHVMEHVPDTIGWLNQIFEVMEDRATLALALPDRRYSMDYYRKEATLGDLIGNWILAPSNPTPAQIVDFLSQSFYDVRPDNRMFDTSQPFEAAPRHYSDKQALEFATHAHNTRSYLDVHCTVWTPSSFVDVMNRVISMGLINAKLSEPIERHPGDEFIVHMTKLGESRAARPMRPYQPIAKPPMRGTVALGRAGHTLNRLARRLIGPAAH